MGQAMSDEMLTASDAAFYAHPRCPDCGVAMWLVRVLATAEREEQLDFECKACGQMTIIECRLT